ncbi:MAG: flagellin [Planctomycetes bacterium]|nr:flagellin [Planctomycetota bacterium]
MARINTNIAAIRAIAQLGKNNRDLQVRLERLSTGLRINRGKDDPAGLIASEALRAGIRSIGQAIINSNRAINVISTAEGALNEVSALLLDIRGLLQASANEGALTVEETDANQLEIDSILASIDRVANTTEFGGKKLLNGSLGYNLSSVDQTKLASIETFSARVPEGAAANVVVQVTASAETGELAYVGTALASAVTFELAGRNGAEILTFASGTTISDVAAGINSVQGITGVSATLSVGGIRLNTVEFGSAQFVSVKSLAGNFVANAGATSIDEGVDVSALVNGQIAKTAGLRVDIRTAGLDARLRLTESFGTQISSTTYNITGGGATFQIAPEISAAGQISLGLNSVSTGNLGNNVIGFLNSLRSGGANEIGSGNFSAAGRVIDEAILQIAQMRGRLGGAQKNQIETNINSQQVALENVQASESVIRDADMAFEISALTRAQILVQSTQLTLQIAIQQPQAVLALLG